MATYKLLLEYDGTAYAGWQRQLAQPTIQSTLEAALARVTQRPTSIVAASRTDAGVHARGQVVGFQSDKPLLLFEWTRALNGVLPKDIGVRRTELVDDQFHARYDAHTKTYEYRILNQSARPALDRFRVWQIVKPLDVSRMCRALRHVTGMHDCTSLQGSPTDARHPMCDIRRIACVREGSLIRVTIQADRFLKHMVRTLVGTLVEVGYEKRAPDDLAVILEARDRRAAGPTAPPQGLCLLRVSYTDEDARRDEDANDADDTNGADESVAPS